MRLYLSFIQLLIFIEIFLPAFTVAYDKNVISNTNRIPENLTSETQNPSITLISPNGGESILESSTYAVSWMGSDNTGIDHYEF